MSYSRKQLERMGEPLGESVTQRHADGRTTYGGGGGSGGGTSTVTKDYSPNQDRLAGVQADISQNLANLSFQNLPTYTANSANMVQDAMDGTLSKQMREQASSDSDAAMGQSIAATNQNLSRYGINPNSGLFADMSRKNAVEGAANKVSAMGNADRWVEDQKWNRNAGAFGQSTMMSNGSMQGMNSAASQYGSMAQGASQNNARNAAGLGAAGASMGSAMFKASGGYIEKKGLKMASGGRVQPLVFAPIDWRNQPTGESSSQQKSSNGIGKSIGYLLAGAAPAVAGAALKGVGSKVVKYGERKFDEWMANQSKDAAANTAQETTNNANYAFAEDAPATTADATTGITSTEVPADTSVDTFGALASSDPAPVTTAVDQIFPYTPSYKSGGSVKKPGLHLAMGGMPTINTPYNSGSYVSSTTTREDDGGANPFAKQAGSLAANQGAKYAFNELTKPAPNNPTGVPAETPGTTPSPVADPIPVQEVPLPDAPAPNVTPVDSAPIDPTAPAQEVGTEAVKDVGTEAVKDVGTEAVKDVGTEVAKDVGTEVVKDVGTTAITDATTTAGSTVAADALATTGTTVAADALATTGTAAVADAALATGASTLAGAAGTGASAAGGAVAGAEAGSIVPGIGTVIGAIAGLAASQLMKADGGEINRTDMTPGGEVSGPGTETSDDIPAWLSDGEYVLNAEAVRLIGKDNLEVVNKAGLAKRENKFACGGAIKHGVKLAGGGFLGGNLGIAMGAGVDQLNRLQQLDQHQQSIDIQREELASRKLAADQQRQLNDMKIAETARGIEKEKKAELINAAVNDKVGSATALNASLKGLKGEEYSNAFKAYSEAGMTPSDLYRQAGVAAGTIDAGKNMQFAQHADSLVAQEKKEAATNRFQAALNNPNVTEEQLARLQADIDVDKGMTNIVGMHKSNLVNERTARLASEKADLQRELLATRLAGSGSKKTSDSVKEEGQAILTKLASGDLKYQGGSKDAPVEVSGLELYPVAQTLYSDIINRPGNKLSPARAAHVAFELAKSGKGVANPEYSKSVIVDENGDFSVTARNAAGVDDVVLHRNIGNPVSFLGGTAEEKEKLINTRKADAALNFFGSKEKAHEAAKLTPSEIAEQVASFKTKHPEANADAFATRLNRFVNHAKVYAKSNPLVVEKDKKPISDGRRWFDNDMPTENFNNEGTPDIAKNAYSKAFNMFADSARKATE